MKVVHVITGLATGGAEMMLLKLLERLPRARFDSEVISLMTPGPVADRLASLPIPVHSLGLRSARFTPTAGMRLLALVRQASPELIQGWMYHGNLAALLARRAKPTAAVAWNIRHSIESLADEKWGTALAIRMGAWCSRWPDAILYNAQVSARQHEAIGYHSRHTLILPNGFDGSRFHPVSPESRRALRHSLGLPENAFLAALVARYHPMKDHAGLIKAAALVAARRPDMRLVLVGRGVDTHNSELMKEVAQYGLADRCHLLGERPDVERIWQAVDLGVLASAYGEGFPNVVGEAMACGVPCVVTDVGDAAWVVGDTGRVVPPRDPQSLSQAWMAMMDLDFSERMALGLRARQRVLDHFAMDDIARRYATAYEAILAGRPSGKG